MQVYSPFDRLNVKIGVRVLTAAWAMDTKATVMEARLWARAASW